MVVFLMSLPSEARSEEFEVFDGRSYNGKFYPRIDIIEWKYPSHDQSNMEFHVYSKGKPIEMSFMLERKDGKVVMLVNYYLKDRDEHLCRRVLAPSHFTEGFHVYKDNSDPDFDNVIVSMDDFPEIAKFKESKSALYASCDLPRKDRSLAAEQAEQAAQKSDALAQSQPQPQQGASRATASEQKTLKPSKGAIKAKGSDVPFSDW